MEKEGKDSVGKKAQGFIRSWLVQGVGRNSVWVWCENRLDDTNYHVREVYCTQMKMGLHYKSQPGNLGTFSSAVLT